MLSRLDRFAQAFAGRSGRVFFQMTVGRAGSLFLQSLVDNHPSVLTFPGSVALYGALAETGGGAWREPLLTHLRSAFDSHGAMNVFERLGPNQDQTLPFTPERIVEETASALGGSPPTRRSLVLAVHYAVGTLLNRNLAVVDTLWLHQHFTDDSVLRAVAEDFPQVRFVINVRDPRSNYLSYRKVQRVSRDPASPQFTEYWLASHSFIRDGCVANYLQAVETLEPIRDRTLVVRLEDLQTFRTVSVVALAQWMGIDEHPTLFESTFGGLSWNGDSYSTPSAGFRTTTTKEGWITQLPPVRGAALELALRGPMASFGYEPHFSRRLWNRVRAWLCFPLWPIDDFESLGSAFYYKHLGRARGESSLALFLRGLRSYLGTLRYLARNLGGRRADLSGCLLKPLSERRRRAS